MGEIITEITVYASIFLTSLIFLTLVGSTLKKLVENISASRATFWLLFVFLLHACGLMWCCCVTFRHSFAKCMAPGFLRHRASGKCAISVTLAAVIYKLLPLSLGSWAV